MFPLLKEGPLIRLSTDVYIFVPTSTSATMRMLGFFLTATWEDMKIRVGKGVGIDRRLCFLVWKVALEMIVSLLVTGDVHCRP